MNCSPYRTDFQDRIAQVKELLRAADPPNSGALASVVDISRSVRGLAIVLLYAAYENLLRGLVRGLLEAAARTGASNRRLRSGFRVSAIARELQAVKDTPGNRFRLDQALAIANALNQSRGCTVEPDWFPDDGTHMRRAQVRSIFRLFALGDPASILKGAWERLDTIVDERNAVAHGRRGADEVGRAYTQQEILDLVNLWEARWLELIARIQSETSVREFFRGPR